MALSPDHGACAAAIQNKLVNYAAAMIVHTVHVALK
jgi:hypothetical protein